jgi:hypothetical protein
MVPSHRWTSSAEHVTRPVQAAIIRRRSGTRGSIAMTVSAITGPMSKRTWPSE